ncbi:BglII/BstYI family type II restriction endonuclease [Desulfonema magnum]|uniref:Restriction endonuclease domain-containing protein n=1 Tax=Desulfonema magnum TaxID=45655 RepID=A0A975BV42_9BACT|nr:BglII/BstYI family type II restriction endonuclease [Desulfonema magnum]QTA91690.1 Restriction endonuclease domain-containing protein [Desulfonema magnum]
MIIAGKYSFNKGEEVINHKYPHLLEEIQAVVHGVNASLCRSKTSKEKTMVGKILYSPKELNKLFKTEFKKLNWKDDKINKVYCDYPTQYYTANYKPKNSKAVRKPYRAMDFLKEKLGVEVQFGKYAFMVYNICAKMTIFKKLGFIDAGFEIVPIKQLADEMSTGVSYFEQFVWDLEKRGVSDIDIPVLVIGVDETE